MSEKRIIMKLNLENLINKMLNPATIIASKYQYSISTAEQRHNMKASGYSVWDLSLITNDNYDFYKQIVDDAMEFPK